MRHRLYSIILAIFAFAALCGQAFGQAAAVTAPVPFTGASAAAIEEGSAARAGAPKIIKPVVGLAAAGGFVYGLVVVTVQDDFDSFCKEAQAKGEGPNGILIDLHGYLAACPDDPSSVAKKASNVALQPQLGDAMLALKSTAKLRSNMKQAGRQVPMGCAAHHIVPELDNRPQFQGAPGQSRDVLQRCGIDINDADNGVSLPDGNKGEQCAGVNHRDPDLHSIAYYMYIARMLATALGRTGCDGVRDELRSVQADLADGVKAWK